MKCPDCESEEMEYDDQSGTHEDIREGPEGKLKKREVKYICGTYHCLVCQSNFRWDRIGGLTRHWADYGGVNSP